MRILTFCILFLLTFTLAHAQDATPEVAPTIITNLAWSPDGQYIALGDVNGTLTLRNISTEAVVFTSKNHSSYITSIKWDTTGSRLATSGYDHTVIIWNTVMGQPAFTLEHTGQSLVAGWSPSGDSLFTYTEQPTALLEWNAHNGSPISQINDSRAGLMFWSPDGSSVATVAVIGFDILNSSNLVSRLQILQTEALTSGYAITTLAWSRNSNLLATGHLNGMIRLWDTTDGHLISTLQASTSSMTTFGWQLSTVLERSFNADGQTLTTLTSDGTIRTWATQTYNVLNTSQISGPVYVGRFSPDGTHLAYVAQDETLMIIEPLALSDD